MRKWLALASLLLVLVVVNLAVFDKEQTLASGKTVLLQLAPVDPRSLMQGDYMALNYVLSQQIYQALPKTDEARRWRHDVAADDGFVVVKPDKDKVAQFVRLDQGESLAKQEMRLFFRVRHGTVKFATNAFFFEEGQAGQYESAEYGEFRVADDGELLLVAMRNADFKLLGTSQVFAEITQ